HAPSKTLSGHNDHRIVMALSVLCSITGGKIDGAQAVSKSLPDFFELLKSLGIKVKLYETA
ncbi:MAG: 3-phosphoshikimate 1-carboxyvinyltransferase, partial [Clostridia bacterium]|nr:3-phosphoshikimate 1-carboxyvinyltransferase [Clostridia bacterium]